MLSFKLKRDTEQWRQWWIGNSIPSEILRSRVVTIQADGHELEAVLLGLQNSVVGPNGRTELKPVEDRS